MGFGVGLEVRKIEGVKWQLASAQTHQSLAGRDVYRTGTLEEFRQQQPGLRDPRRVGCQRMT